MRKVSIGIVCYNEEKNIGALLEDLTCQRTDDQLEIRDIIAVASGCTDATVEIIGDFASRDARVMMIAEEERRGKPSAINRILEEMGGDYLVLFSGDLRVPDRRFIGRIMHQFHDGVGGVGVRPVPDNNGRKKSGYMGSTLWRLHDKTLEAQARHDLRRHFGEAFAILKNAVPPIPPNIINDDAYMVLAIQQQGYQVRYSRDLVVFNTAPRGVKEFVQQRARIVRGHRQLREVMGASPDVLDALIFKRPWIALSVLANEVKEQVKMRHFKPLWFLQFLASEMAAHLIAVLHPEEITNLWPRVSPDAPLA